MRVLVRCVLVFLVATLSTTAMAAYVISFGQGSGPISDLSVVPGEEVALRVLVGGDDPCESLTFTSFSLQLDYSDPTLLGTHANPGIEDASGFGVFHNIFFFFDDYSLLIGFNNDGVEIPYPNWLPVAEMFIRAPMAEGSYLLTLDDSQDPNSATNVSGDYVGNGLSVSDLIMTVTVPDPATLGLIVLGGLLVATGHRQRPRL